MAKPVTANLDFGSAARIENLPTPAAAGEAATKGYVDGRTPKITAGTSAPGSPAVNDIWIDTN